MKLVGMLDSPYVRRLAITMRMLEIPFEHESRSVVAGYESFKDVNPLAKVPTLILDDGEMLIESSLIISYLESLSGRTLMPTGLDRQRRAWQLIAVALLGMDKAVARVYETEMRPEEYQYEPWLRRIEEQTAAAFDWLEEAAAGIGDDAWFFGEVSQADISTAVAWRFLQARAASLVLADQRPALAELGARAEALPEFVACPLD